MGGAIREISRLDEWRGRVLWGAIVLCPVVYSFRTSSFLLPKELVLSLGLCFMAALILLRRSWNWAGVRAFLPLWLLVAGSAVVHLIIDPARVPSLAVVELTRITLLLLVPALAFDLLRRPKWRLRLEAALVASALPVALLGLLQYARLIPYMFPEFPTYTQRAYSVFGNQDLFGGYLAIALPLAVLRLLRIRRLDHLSAVSLPVLLAGILISGSRAAWLATLVGTALLLPLARRRPRRAFALAAVAALAGVAATVAAPEATVGRIESALGSSDVGYQARLWIWDGAARMVRDHPWVGVGPGNFAYWSPLYLAESLHAGGPERFHNELHAAHAESEVFEILSETGAMGVALCLWMLARLLRRPSPEWGPLAALLVYGLFSFPFHSAPHALAGLMLAGLLLARTRPGRLPEGRAALALPVLAFALTGIFLWASFIPATLLGQADRSAAADNNSLALYERAARWPWPNYEAHAKYAYALINEERADEARAHLLHALKGRDTGDIHYGLGAAAILDGDNDEASRHLRECVYRWPGSEIAWDLLIATTPPPQREPLVRESRRWKDK